LLVVRQVAPQDKENTMAQAASVNFQKITSTLHAVGHASRQVPPGYLMPANQSMGAHCLIDDQGEVHKAYKAKLALASRQAKKEESYSPLWEGVLNLPDKLDSESLREYTSRCVNIVFRWCDEYQKLTQHKVLRADLHLDEGHLNETGEVVFNPHAHIMCDRTNDAGRVIKIDRAGMRLIQTMTSEVTELKRGEDARITRRKHINSHAYKSLAESNRLETQKAIKEAREQGYKEGYAAAKQDLEDRYKREREALKASGEAIQRDYQTLKAAYLDNLRNLKELQAKQQAAPAPAIDIEARHAKRIANLAQWEARAKLCAGAEFSLLEHLIAATKGKDKHATIDGRAVVRAAQLEALRNGQSHEAMVAAVQRHAGAGIKLEWLLPKDQAMQATSRPPERSNDHGTW
jgi:hypothetical protein